MTRRRQQGGSALVEFTMTGVPLLFIWIGIIQISLGMWHYHTLQYAIKQAGSYLTVHGSSTGYCKSNNCRVEDVATIMATYALGMQQSTINMTFTPVASDHTTKGAATTCTLDACQTNTTAFPNGNPEFEIQAEYQFTNALGMVAPGAGGVVKFQNPWFPAYTHQVVLY
jgi:Flp pilus assembly protein TadG